MKPNFQSKIFALLIIYSAQSYSAPHFGEIFQLKQPNETAVQVKVWGDEFYQDIETLDGYTLIRDKETGWISYATLSEDGKEYVPSGIIYTGSDMTNLNKESQTSILKNLKKHTRIKPESISQKRADARAALNQDHHTVSFKRTEEAGEPQSFKPEVDTIIALGLLIDFPDQKANMTRKELDDFFNKKGYGVSGSVKDYFYDVSNGRFVYINIVPEFVTVTRNKSYYDTPNGYGPVVEMINDALRRLDDRGFDFSKLSTKNGRIISINALYAGRPDHGWANGLWPHQGGVGGNYTLDGVRPNKFQITFIDESVNMGTILHENGHMLFGWPDLYSYDGHTSGIGQYGIMCNHNRTYPPPPNPYFRSLEGWIKIIDITNAPRGSVFSHQANSHSAFLYSKKSNGANELYFIEARRKKGRSTLLPDEGLAIWHIDKNGNNTKNGNELLVALEQADGRKDLDNARNLGDSRDLFDANSNNHFNDNTLPEARWHDNTKSGIDIANISEIGDVMTFSIGIGGTEVVNPKMNKHTNMYISNNILHFSKPTRNIVIKNISGETLLQGNVSSTSTFNVSLLPEGVYFAVFNGHKIKFVKT